MIVQHLQWVQKAPLIQCWTASFYLFQFKRSDWMILWCDRTTVFIANLTPWWYAHAHDLQIKPTFVGSVNTSFFVVDLDKQIRCWPFSICCFSGHMDNERTFSCTQTLSDLYLLINLAPTNRLFQHEKDKQCGLICLSIVRNASLFLICVCQWKSVCILIGSQGWVYTQWKYNKMRIRIL